MLFCSDQVRSDSETVLSVGLFVLHKCFEMLLTKKSLIVGGQYGILFAREGEVHESSQRENYEKKSRGNSRKECRKVKALASREKRR